MNNTLKVIKERRTTRKFKNEQIKKEELDAIIEAGLYAPSAHNNQPWHFTVIQNQELINELNLETKDSAKYLPGDFAQMVANNEDFNIFYEAPTVVIVSGDDKGVMPQVDCAAATQNMFIAAESLEIGGCWNGIVGILFAGDKKDKYIEQLNIPEGHTPYYAAVFGYTETRTQNAPARRAERVNYL